MSDGYDLFVISLVTVVMEMTYTDAKGNWGEDGMAAAVWHITTITWYHFAPHHIITSRHVSDATSHQHHIMIHKPTTTTHITFNTKKYNKCAHYTQLFTEYQHYNTLITVSTAMILILVTLGAAGHHSWALHVWNFAGQEGGEEERSALHFIVDGDWSCGCSILVQCQIWGTKS